MYFHNLRVVHQSSNFMTDSTWQGYKSTNMLGCSLLFVCVFECLFVCLFFLFVCSFVVVVVFAFVLAKPMTGRGFQCGLVPNFSLPANNPLRSFCGWLYFRGVPSCGAPLPSIESPFGLKLLRWRRSLPTYTTYIWII